MILFYKIFMIHYSSNRRPKRRRLTKAERLQNFQAGPFCNIVDRDSLIQFLKENSNSYNDKILTFINRQTEFLELEYDEIHHIIPKSEGGPDASWNLLPVFYNEHKELHKLRYDLYHQEGDRVASMSRDKIVVYSKQQRTEASKRGHQTMKKLKISFYDPITQAELERRSSQVGKTPAREKGYAAQAKNSRYQAAFQQSIKFLFKDSQTQFSVESSPNQFERTDQIKDYLIQFTPISSPFYEQIKNDKSFTTNFNKVLRNLLPGIDKREARPTYKGWSVEVIVK
uniref:HNH homing endonuclease n=1 Tax=Coelastrella saipanensis TaxID=152631 RepID=UPI0010C38D67|nr:HNH homing endonuclease [Coelastrella saipanensis]AVV61581.1 HNH homing endonuclease [Coelastrella saipanensis]